VSPTAREVKGPDPSRDKVKRQAGGGKGHEQFRPRVQARRALFNNGISFGKCISRPFRCCTTSDHTLAHLIEQPVHTGQQGVYIYIYIYGTKWCMYVRAMVCHQLKCYTVCDYIRRRDGLIRNPRNRV
jgi:hypothetical protein